MHIHLWPYKAIYIGVSPDNDVHAHHAVQICIGLDKNISVQNYRTKMIHTGHCIVIFEDVPHKLFAQAGQIVVIYLEPEDRQNQQFLTALRQARSDGINTLPLKGKDLGSISQQLFTDVDIEKLWKTVNEAIGLVYSPSPSPRPEDKRVRAVIDIIASQRGCAIDMAFLSSKVFLSPSRLTHLFKQEVGIPISRFIVWWRVRAAIEQLSKSATLTGNRSAGPY